MKPREKRTSTEPGLGQAAAGDGAGASRTTDTTERRERTVSSESPAPTPPRPPSGAPPSARHTRALERPRISRDDDDVPTDTARAAREEMPFDRLEQLERLERARQDRTETPRSPGVEPRGGVSRPPPVTSSRIPPPTASSPGSGNAGSRPASSVPPGSHRSQRPIEGRPVRTTTKPPSGGGGGGGPGRSSRPSGRPPRQSVVPPATSTVPPRRSPRASIRVDDLGDGVGAVSAVPRETAARQVPRLLKTKDEIAAAPIDHRAGFLLAHIDGMMTVQALVDIASMPEDEVHEILERLRRLGIVALR